MIIVYLNGKRRTAGFTMIEAVIAMVITSILASMVAVFIAGPVTAYLEGGRRSELTDVADLVLRRLSRETRLALPNSLRVTDTTSTGACSSGTCYIEFIATSGGGQYTDVNDGTTGYPLNFSDTVACTSGLGANSNCKFDVIGAMPANPPISAGDYIVVYNQGQNANGLSYAPADAYATADPCTDCNRAQVATVGIVDSAPNFDINGRADTVNTVKLVPFGGANVFAKYTAGNTPPLKSKTQRFNVVPGTVMAVTFSCLTPPATGPLYRYQGYGFYSTQAPAIAAALAGAPADRTTMALNASCIATYNATASQRNGLLTVTLTLNDSANKESVTLVREIHLDNSP